MYLGELFTLVFWAQEASCHYCLFQESILLFFQRDFVFLFDTVFFFLFETGLILKLSLAWNSLCCQEWPEILSQPCECWDYRHMSPHLTSGSIFRVFCIHSVSEYRVELPSTPCLYISESQPLSKCTFLILFILK